MPTRIPSSLLVESAVSASLPPGGRLTLSSGNPVMPHGADYSSATLYYAPFESDQVPIIGSGARAVHQFTSGLTDQVGLSMVGGTAWVAGTSRDVFVTLVNGAPRLCTGPAWPGETMAQRSIARRAGLWVNSAQMTCDLAQGDQVVVPANEATWVGSIHTATTGTLTAQFTLGQNRRCDVWNAYNQREVLLGVGCPPPGGTGIVLWQPSAQYPAWQAFNNDINNSGYYFTGLPQNVECQYIQRGFVDSLNFGVCAAISLVCKDTIGNAVGTINSFSSDTTSDAFGFAGQSVFIDRDSIGVHRAIMGTANANSTDGATLWGLAYTGGRAPEDAHVMWIKYQG